MKPSRTDRIITALAIFGLTLGIASLIIHAVVFVCTIKGCLQ